MDKRIVGLALLLPLVACGDTEAAGLNREALDRDQVVIADALRSGVAELGPRLLVGEACLPELLDLVYLALLGAGTDGRSSGQELHFPVCSESGFEVTLVALAPGADQDRFEVRIRGARLFGGLPEQIKQRETQEVDLGFALDRSGHVRWATFIFKSLDRLNSEETMALVGQDAVNTGVVVKYRPEQSVEWQPLTLKVQHGPDDRALETRNLGQVQPVGKADESSERALLEITPILLQFRRVG